MDFKTELLCKSQSYDFPEFLVKPESWMSMSPGCACLSREQWRWGLRDPFSYDIEINQADHKFHVNLGEAEIWWAIYWDGP